MKAVRKALFYLVLVFSVLLIALVASVFLFKDKIINQFIQEANKRLNTPVKVGKMDVSVFQEFPQLSIILNDVYVEDSHSGQYPLLTAKKIAFQLNPIEVWNGDYTIKGLRIEDSETNLKINAKGENNYTVLKDDGARPSKAGDAIQFELKNVKLKNTRVHYLDLNAKEHLIFASRTLRASIRTARDVYDIEAEGELLSEDISIEGNSFLKGKLFDVRCALLYDDVQKILTINPSQLALKDAVFTLQGDYRWKGRNTIDLETRAEEADIQTLLSLLPASAHRNLEKYQSKGTVYFNAKVKGEMGGSKSPSISVDFGFTEATIFHPEYKSRIEGASLTGSFASGEIANAAVAALVLKNMKGKLNGEPFAANFVLRNFKSPEVICDFRGQLDAASLLDFYPMENIKNITGTLLADVAFEGKIELLKRRATAQRVSTRGTVDLHDINLTYGVHNIPLQHLNGSLQFNNNDLALSNVSGKLGHSDFLFNGFFKNIITFLLFENQPIGIETDLKSDYLDLDELLAIGYGNPSKDPSQAPTQKYAFSISPNVHLNFNCDVKALRYQRFYAQDIHGDLLVKNQVAVSRSLSLKTMGGSLTLSAIVDANNNKAIDVSCTSKLSGIHLDSAFYVFRNFDQTFIEDRHLKGQATADVDLELALNPNLRLFPETLIADISATIKNGELNNFEPLKKLNKYLDDEGLSRLRFSDLKNDIHIEHKTIYIPQMEVRSNVTDIKISGTHSFDQHIDYRLVAPLRGKKKVDTQAALGAIENDGAGQSKLFLKIIGTTDNYRIVYDTESVKKKIVSDLKKEVQDLKEAFKNKGVQKKKELELDKDEYFDWDDNQY